MTCFYCKGNIESSTTTYMTDYQGCYIILKNVPCEKCSLTGHDGLIRGSRIAIRKDIETQAEKSCVLAEEIGHYRTSSGNILDQNKVESRKQEYRARLYGYNLKIGLAGLISAYEAGCRNLYEMAEYLNATEEYLKEAIQCYHSKYGVIMSFISNHLR